MPKKYVLVSSSSSSVTSLRYSSENSSSDSDSPYSRRHRRGRRRRHDRSPRRHEEPSEGFHWWLARWLSSEFAKLALSVYEGGKGCIRYLSNTALQALPSVRTARELLGVDSRPRRSRDHRHGRISPYPGGSGESLRVRKSRKSQRRSRQGRNERSSSPFETSPRHQKKTKHSHKPPFVAVKQGSSHSRHHRSLKESWIYEENWIENLLKEVKSSFKNPVKVKVYKVTPSEGLSKSRSDHSQTDSKLSISIEELVSPTYPSGNSEVISTSSGRKRSERDAHSEEKVPKSKSELKRPAKDFGKFPTPKITHRNSVSRLSPSDLSRVGKDALNLAEAPPNSVPPEGNRQVTSCPDGSVFYPTPGVKCRVVCEYVSSSSDASRSETSKTEYQSRSEQTGALSAPQSEASCGRPVCSKKDTDRSPVALKEKNNESNERNVIPEGDMGFSAEGELLHVKDPANGADANLSEASKKAEEESDDQRSTVRLPEGSLTNRYKTQEALKVDSCSVDSGSTVDVHPSEMSKIVHEEFEAQLNVRRSAVRLPRGSLVQGNDIPHDAQDHLSKVKNSCSNIDILPGEASEKAREESKGQCGLGRSTVEPPLGSLINENEIQEAVPEPSSYEDSGSKIIEEEFEGRVNVRRSAVRLPRGSLVPGNRNPEARESKSESRISSTSDPLIMEKSAVVPDGMESVPSSLEQKEPSAEENLALELVEEHVSVGGFEKLEFPDPDGQKTRNERKSLSRNGSGTSQTKAPPAPDHSAQLPLTDNERNTSDVSRSITVGTLIPTDVRKPTQAKKRAQPEYVFGYRRSASVKTQDDDPAMLFRMTVRKGETAEVGNVEVSGVSMLGSASKTGSTPFCETSRNNSEQAVKSHVSVGSSEHHSATLQPGTSRTACMPSLVKSKDSLSSTKGAGSVSGNTLTSSSKGILKNCSSKSAHVLAEKLKAPFKSQVPGGYEAVHPELSRSSSKELMEVITDRSLSSPGLKSSSKDSLPKPSKRVSTPADVNNFAVMREQNDEFFVVVSETNQLDSPSKPTVRSARSIVESVTGSSGASSESTRKHLMQCDNVSENSQTVSPEGLGSADSNCNNRGIEMTLEDSIDSRDRDLQDPYIFPRRFEFPKLMQLDGAMVVTASVAAISGIDDFETSEDGSVRVAESLSEAKQNESAVSPLLNESDSKDSEVRLTFGEVEKMSFLDPLSSHSRVILAERFKMLEKPSTAKSTLPPIQEEVEAGSSGNDPGRSSPAPSIIQQRRQSKVTPGMLKSKSRPSTFSTALSTASTYTEGASDGSDSEYSQCATALDRCPCKKICECCTCSRRGSEKHSFLSRSASRDRPSSRPPSEALVKTVSKPRPPRIGAIDMSSPPFPKNSFDVLRSPFYAHWDYYDLDQDHPVARFVRRPDQAEFDNTDTVLMKNVRVGGYTIPCLKVQTKEKVTSKMICNFYKQRKLPAAIGKGNTKATVGDSNFGAISSESGKTMEEVNNSKKCRCKKGKEKMQEEEEEENIWKDFVKEDGAELMEFPTDVVFEKSCCSKATDEGCMCLGQPSRARTIPVPPTPCESCDCFISDVELESAPQLIRQGPMGSATDLSDSEDSLLAERNAIVTEYICGMQELCSSLCSMIGQMRLIIGETSTSGSTFRSLRTSPQRLSLRGSPDLDKSPKDEVKK